MFYAEPELILTLAEQDRMLGNKQKVTKLDIINHLAKAMVSLRGQEGSILGTKFSPTN